MDLRISGRVALVCGSTSGLGLAIATELAREGCRVAVNGRDVTRLKHARATVAAVSADVNGFAADISEPAQAVELVRRVQHHFGALDILVCNAGGPPSGGFNNTSAEQWSKALDLSLLSSIHLCRAAVPLMQERGWGRIVCLTSVAAKEPLPGLMLSTTARAGVLGFAKALADELAPHGITVNSVCPGYMNTERVQELVDETARRERRQPDEIRAGMVARIPMQRMGDPQELAATVAFIASMPAGYLTGVALQVDGGYVRSIL
ncbi:MAG: SDR family oxidoreductase [Gemmatimonadota bacterium]|nr:MAG: SDR family oxidoreductase [Gemmatimonadota bacterium]